MSGLWLYSRLTEATSEHIYTAIAMANRLHPVLTLPNLTARKFRFRQAANEQEVFAWPGRTDVFRMQS
jgi:dihydroorotase